MEGEKTSAIDNSSCDLNFNLHMITLDYQRKKLVIKMRPSSTAVKLMKVAILTR